MVIFFSADFTAVAEANPPPFFGATFFLKQVGGTFPVSKGVQGGRGMQNIVALAPSPSPGSRAK